MKKIKLLKTLLIPTIGITAIGTIAAVSTSCSSSAVPVASVSLDKESLPLPIGDYYTLTATVQPENATDKSLTWSSSDSSVATVDDGKVTAVGEGQATITVKTNDGGFTATCDVTVVDASAVICVTANEDSRLELKNAGENNPNLQYSDDGKNWTTYSGIINIPANGKIYLKGDNANGWSQSSIKYSNFVITGNVSLYGNIMGLLDNRTGAISSIPNDYCFYNLFYGSTGITSVSEDFLPATTLADSCYYAMFQNCTSLTTAPNLPATTLADSCYAGMFHSCTSLTAAPDLPATTLALFCYQFMFQGCTSLTTAHDLPATNLASYCYQFMFNGCTSLTTAPDLPATTLADFCYWNMFNGCTSLLRAPNVLPATNLVFGCYASMFQGCTSLTTAPDLPATQLVEGCYSLMFYNCHRLALIRIGYNGTVSEASSGGSFTNWVTGVAQIGTFYYKGSDTLENFGFPSSWTINPN